MKKMNRRKFIKLAGTASVYTGAAICCGTIIDGNLSTGHAASSSNARSTPCTHKYCRYYVPPSVGTGNDICCSSRVYRSCRS